MTARRAFVASALVFLISFFIGASGTPLHNLAGVIPPLASGPAPSATPQPTEPPAADPAIRAAFQTAVEQKSLMLLGLVIYDPVITNIQYSKDGSIALLWVGLRDKESGEILATEPGLSIARNANLALAADPANWSVTMQVDPTFTDQLRALPADLLSNDIQTRFLGANPTALELSGTQPFSGYKLPWTAGLSKYVTNSIGHVYAVSGGLASCPSTCRFAYDFADGTMFPLLAAKGGTVKAFRTSCPNNQSSCTNFFVLEDQSTIPTTYQLYYHMANNTIPGRLRQIGAVVRQGEYIGDADNTGYSTGSHLHFHVYTSPNTSDWSWGTSVDFTFDDVANNGGRPRTCAEAAQYPNLGAECMPRNLYTSGNTPANPPVGSLDVPANRQVITSGTVWVQGTASDDIAVTRIRVQANYDGTWKTIGDIPPAGDGTYGQSVDLCAAGVPDGPLALTVNIFDREGSQAAGLPVLQLIKNYACTSKTTPPAAPACSPTANQVALYTGTDYQGSCTKFDSSTSGYTANLLGAVGENTTASIQVGSSVQAVLYERSEDVNSIHPNGRIEVFEKSDANLADNQIGINTVSGLRVQPRSTAPDEVFFNSTIGNRVAAGTNPSSIDSLVLSWEGGTGATSFDVKLTGPSTNLAQTITRPSISVGSLAAGNYSLTVLAKNSAAGNTSSKTFTVSAGSLPAASARTIPYLDTMEAGAGDWVASGLWRLGAIDAGGRGSTQAWIYNNGSSYNDATWRAGDLTSPPIQIPAGAPSYLRFSYYKDTEDGNPYWDQRLVQISADNGPFKDLRQLSDDQQVGQIWLNSGPINLAAYAGKTIRVRFHFDTIDEDNNNGSGWMVDDVSINSQGPDTACADNDNSPDTAQAMVIGSMATGELICPEGDIDYYSFTAKAGQQIIADIDAMTLNPSSTLDSYLSLLDSDQHSVLAENDDEQPGVLRDSLIRYTLKRDGTYYLKVKAWDYPGSGSRSNTYSLTLRPPDISLTVPYDVRVSYPTTLVPNKTFNITAAAMDYDGGPVTQMDFYWHGADWSKSWVKLGTDTDGSDGWNFPVTPASYGEISGSALYVQATSHAGGVKGYVMWDLILDNIPPYTRLNPLPDLVNSTAIRLSWVASDPGNDIDHYDLQYQVNNGSWQNWTVSTLPGKQFSTWFTGVPGSHYGFRIRATDQLGNQAAFPDQAETSVTFAASCTPVNDSGQSAPVPLDSEAYSPQENFCQSSAAPTGDVDWFAVPVTAGKPMLLMILPGGGGAAFKVDLFKDLSSTLILNSAQSVDFENGVNLKIIPIETGTYYLRVKPAWDGMAGTDMRYQIWYGTGAQFYLPVIGH